MQSANAIQKLLEDFGLCDPSTVETVYHRVRDRDDVRVLRCSKSGVIFLSRSDHLVSSQWTAQEGFGYWSAECRAEVLAKARPDDERRARDFGPLVAGKRWLDVGAGAGGVLEQMASLATEAVAVEPQPEAREALLAAGYEALPGIPDLGVRQFDVITLFHVFEHLVEPLESLRALRAALAPGGRIIIEVPHARDFLIDFLQVEEFMAFTFWSEHLILHTRESLRTFLRQAGFRDVSVRALQRYPLENHLHWLARKGPGGHHVWRELGTRQLEAAYEAMLAGIDRTDTLLAFASS